MSNSIKHLVDQASTAELSSEAMTKHFGKAILVMIVAVSGRIIKSSNVDHRVQWLQNLGVSGSNDLGCREFVSEAKHEAGESFVTVKAAIVGSNSCSCRESANPEMV